MGTAAKNVVVLLLFLFVLAGKKRKETKESR